jgi:hypothetical protein
MSAPKLPDFHFTHFGLHIQPFASDEELWAIGLVAMLWNHVERSIAVIADALTAYDPKLKLEVRAIKTMDRRLGKLREIIVLKVLPEHIPTLLSFVNRIGSMLAQRDKIIHGAWVKNINQIDPAKYPSKHLINSTPYQKEFKWSLTYERIFKVASQIDRLILDIHEYQESLFDPSTDRLEAFSHDTLRHTLKERGPLLELPPTIPRP